MDSRGKNKNKNKNHADLSQKFRIQYGAAAGLVFVVMCVLDASPQNPPAT